MWTLPRIDAFYSLQPDLPVDPSCLFVWVYPMIWQLFILGQQLLTSCLIPSGISSESKSFSFRKEFHSNQAECSSQVGENWSAPGKTTWPSVRTCLSHTWAKHHSISPWGELHSLKMYPYVSCPTKTFTYTGQSGAIHKILCQCAHTIFFWLIRITSMRQF